MNDKATVYILALVVFLIGTVEYIITGIIGLVASDLGVSTAEAGLLVTVFALAAAALAPVLIALTLNIDRKKLLLSTLGIFIAGNGLIMFDPSYEALLAIRMVQGASGGMTTVLAMAVATRMAEKEKRGQAIGIILMGLSGSLVLGVPIGTWMSAWIGWKLLFAAVGLASLVPLLIIGRRVPSIKEKEKVTLAMQLSLLKNKKILLALTMTLLYVSGYALLFTYITPFLQATSNLSINAISLILFIAGICSFAGSKVGGQWADARGSRFTVYFGLAFQAAALLLFGAVGLQAWIAVPALMLFMLATWSISPAQQLHLVTLAPQTPDLALGVNTSFIQFGFALGSALGGWVISGSSVLYLNGAGLVAVGLAVLMAVWQFRAAGLEDRAARQAT